MANPVPCRISVNDPQSSLKAGERRDGAGAPEFAARTCSEQWMGCPLSGGSPFRRPAMRRSLREAQQRRQSNRLASFVETTAPLRTTDYRFGRVAISSPA